jgi:hypothetical protein
MRRIAAALLATACLTMFSACGSPSPAHSRQVDREWIDNTLGVIDQLQRDLTLQSGGGTLRAAREALRSGLYPSLVAYTDFGGCRHMISAAGAAPGGFAAASRPLDAACALLQRAAVLFTRGASRHDAAALVRADHVAVSAAPLLLRAEVELKSLSQATATSR